MTIPMETVKQVLVDILIHHVATPTSGCGCGKVKLGGSYAEHIAELLEQECTKETKT
jgi:hypothetical protein